MGAMSLLLCLVMRTEESESEREREEGRRRSARDMEEERETRERRSCYLPRQLAMRKLLGSDTWASCGANVGTRERRKKKGVERERDSDQAISTHSSSLSTHPFHLSLSRSSIQTHTPFHVDLW